MVKSRCTVHRDSPCRKYVAFLFFVLVGPRQIFNDENFPIYGNIILAFIVMRLVCVSSLLRVLNFDKLIRL